MTKPQTRPGFTFKLARISSLSLLTLATSLFANLALAEDLSDIFNLAADNDPQIRQARANYNAQHTLLDQGRSQLLPSLNLTASYSRQANGIDGTPTNPNQTQFAWDNNYPSKGYGLSLRQNLLNFQAWYAYQSAKKSDQVAALTLASAEQELIMRVTIAYFTVLRSLENLESFRAEEDAAQRILEQTQERFEVGLVPITDVYDSQANHDLARVNRLVEENTLNQSYEGLEAITGMPHNELSTLREDFPIEPADSTIENWMMIGLQNNLSVQSAEMDLEAKKDDAKAAKAVMYPTVDLSAGYNWRESDQFAIGSVVQQENFPSENANVTFNFSLPLYTGGLNSARKRQAYYTRDASEEVLLRTRRETTQSIRNSYRSLQTDTLAVEARAQAIISAESALEATVVGAEVGTRNVVDVVIAQRTLFNARRDHANARYSYVLDSLSLKQAAGTLSPQDVIDLNQWLME